MVRHFELVGSEVHPLTRELAVEFADMKPSVTERSLDKKRLKYLEDKARDGLLVNFQWARAKVNGEWIRVNGQHSSYMLKHLNDEFFPSDCSVHVDDYKITSQIGLTELFRQFDARRSSRSPTDICGAYVQLIPEIREISVPYVKLGIEGAIFYRRWIMGAPVNQGDDIYGLAGETALHPFFHWLPQFLGEKRPDLKKRPIVGAMYACHDRDPDDATDFWHDVFHYGKEYEPDHPTTILSNFYQEQKALTDTSKRWKPIPLWQAAIYTWNAVRTGREIKSITLSQVKSVDVDLK